MSLTSYRAAPSRGKPVALAARTRYLAIGTGLGKGRPPGAIRHILQYGLGARARHGAMSRTAPGGAESGPGERLRTASAEVLGEARRQVDDPEIDGATAVHEFRKAMKRWRSILRLYEPLF